MSKESMVKIRTLKECVATEKFLSAQSEESFSDLFDIFTPQLVTFFLGRRCELTVAEDLAQEVMLIVYGKAVQIRDRTLFRGWLFRIARNVLCRHYGKQTREVDTVALAEVTDRFASANQKPGAMPAFEFMQWMGFLDSREREVMTLRFIEELEYHEIASAQGIPIGTVQSRVFNAKKKLAPYLTNVPDTTWRAT